MNDRRFTVQQRNLARILRSLREYAGLTIEQVSEKLEMSASKISRIETGQLAVRTRDVREMLEIYEIGEEQRTQVLELARHLQEPYWSVYRSVPSIALAGLESRAASIGHYAARVIPGLLQTREYAREVIRSTHLSATVEEVEWLLESRMRSQELVTGRGAPDLWAVLDEPTVRRSVGGLAVMRAQLQRLIDVSALPNVTLQVLPLSVGPHAGMDGEFTRFGYSDPAVEDVVYIENIGWDIYLDDPDEIQRYARIFDHLRAAALNPAESVRFLTEVQNELQR